MIRTKSKGRSDEKIFSFYSGDLHLFLLKVANHPNNQRDLLCITANTNVRSTGGGAVGAGLDPIHLT